MSKIEFIVEDAGVGNKFIKRSKKGDWHFKAPLIFKIIRDGETILRVKLDDSLAFKQLRNKRG